MLNSYGDLHRFLENGVVQNINSDKMPRRYYKQVCNSVFHNQVFHNQALGLLLQSSRLASLLDITFLSHRHLIVCHPFSPLSALSKRFFFSAPSPAFIVCRLLDRSHSDWREMVPHCGFDLHFPDNE